MPTSRKRHTITETDAVERALTPLRQRGVPVDLGELVVRGAGAMLDELDSGRSDDERRTVLRRRFLDRTRQACGFELDTALTVRDSGWISD